MKQLKKSFSLLKKCQSGFEVDAGSRFWIKSRMTYVFVFVILVSLYSIMSFQPFDKVSFQRRLESIIIQTELRFWIKSRMTYVFVFVITVFSILCHSCVGRNLNLYREKLRIRNKSRMTCVFVMLFLSIQHYVIPAQAGIYYQVSIKIVVLSSQYL